MRTLQMATHQADEQEKDEEGAAKDGVTVDITIPHCRHGHDEEVHTRPVWQRVGILKVHGVAWVLQLWQYSNNMELLTYFIHTSLPIVKQWKPQTMSIVVVPLKT